MPTKMAVFFEGLQHRVWITTLKLGVRGRSWEPLCRNARWLFFLKNPVKFFCNFHANATVKVDRQSDFTCNHLCLSAFWENSTKVDGKAHLLCNLTHAANVQHTCNTRATQRATRAFLLQIPMIFARRCKICSFSF